MDCPELNTIPDECGGKIYLSECIQSAANLPDIEITTNSTQKDINKNIATSLHSLFGRVLALENL
jgi:hypothetical protein